MLPQKFDLDDYKKILLRRKWYVIVPFIVTLVATAVYILITPRVYRASTLILVQRQTVPENYIRPTVTASLSDRISTIKQQVTSRTNLETLVDKYELYASKDPSADGLTMQDKVELMRENITVQVHRGAAFSISFVYPDPQKVMRVANDLTANFIDENLREREAQSIGTTEFLENELAQMKADLEEKEAALTAYKQQHMGGLPDQLNTNFSMLKQLSDKSVSIERSLDEARTQKIMLQGQISNLKSMSESLPVMNQGDFSGLGAEPVGSPELEQLKQRLETLRLRYKENHPDVLKVKKMIARLEEQLQQPVADDAAHPPEGVVPSGDYDIFAGQLEALVFQMSSIEQTIRSLQAEKAGLEKKIDLLKQLIEDTPRRQLELITLQRGYDTIKSQYDNVLEKKLQSQLASNMEKRQKGEQFKVVDRAKLPEKPFRPNVPKLLLAGLFAGLAAGLGLALGLEYLDQSFRDHKEMGEFLQVPVLAVIPRMPTAVEIRKRHRFRVFACCLSGCLLLAIGVGIWLWVNGNLQEWVQRIRNFV
jgi:polysaccharide chain length determinant protein (PEP-CTERM system associated)